MSIPNVTPLTLVRHYFKSGMMMFSRGNKDAEALIHFEEIIRYLDKHNGLLQQQDVRDLYCSALVMSLACWQRRSWTHRIFTRHERRELSYKLKEAAQKNRYGGTYIALTMLIAGDIDRSWLVNNWPYPAR